MLAQSRRALEYLHPDNLAFRTTAYWTLGFAYQLQGDRAAARRAYTEAIALSQASGDIFTTILATIGLGNVQEADNQLRPGGRDLPARPATGRGSAAADYLRSASGPGPYLLRMERPGGRRAARATEPPPGAAVWSK